MNGMEQFISTFGHVTLLQLIELIMAFCFGWYIFVRVKQFLIDKHKREEKYNADLKEALEAVRKYPEYRNQSIQIQRELEDKIQAVTTGLNTCLARLENMENLNTRRARNQLRDRLLQSYRYYTDPEKNPSGSWTRMEAEAFWEQFKDYEEAGGDGLMHTEVEPAMHKLAIRDF